MNTARMRLNQKDEGAEGKNEGCPQAVVEGERVCRSGEAEESFIVAETNELRREFGEGALKKLV